MKKATTETAPAAPTHSYYEYLQLQPLEESDDGTVSDLDMYLQDETINLDEDLDEAVFDAEFNQFVDAFKNDTEKLTFSEE